MPFRPFHLQPPGSSSPLVLSSRLKVSVPTHLGVGFASSFEVQPIARRFRRTESSSLSLRTGRSPPVAPHPASRRRSYWMDTGERASAGEGLFIVSLLSRCLHPPVHVRFHAHDCGGLTPLFWTRRLDGANRRRAAKGRPGMRVVKPTREKAQSSLRTPHDGPRPTCHASGHPTPSRHA